MKSMMLLTIAMIAIIWGIPRTAHAAKARALPTAERLATKQELLLIAGLQSTLDLTFEPCAITEECIRVANKLLLQVQFSKEKKQLIFTPVKNGETTIEEVLRVTQVEEHLNALMDDTKTEMWVKT